MFCYIKKNRNVELSDYFNMFNSFTGVFMIRYDFLKLYVCANILISERNISFNPEIIPSGTLVCIFLPKLLSFLTQHLAWKIIKSGTMLNLPMKCLISFAWGKSTCQERVGSDKIQNEKFLVHSGTRTHNPSIQSLMLYRLR